MIGYLNINHFENKVINFGEICHQAPTDIICVDETKLDSSYSDFQFHIDDYQFPPFCRDRNKYHGLTNCTHGDKRAHNVHAKRFLRARNYRQVNHLCV